MVEQAPTPMSVDPKDVDEVSELDSQPILVLSRSITVRPARTDDAAEWAVHCNNRKIWLNMRDTFPYPYTLEHSESFIKVCHDKAKWLNSGPGHGEGAAMVWEGPLRPTIYVIAIDDRPVGSLGLSPKSNVHRRVAELGYWIGEDFWGKGIMSEVIKAFLPWAFATFDQLLRIEASHYDWNPASGAVLKKAGMEYEGRKRGFVWKDGQIIGVTEYGMVRDNVPA